MTQPRKPSAATLTLGDDLTVSAIGFGAMALTPVYGEVDDTESLATLNRCLDLGVTFIDTANVYGGGDNERLISKVLADRRDEVTLATKFGIVRNPADRGAAALPPVETRRTSASASMKALLGYGPTWSTFTTCTGVTSTCRSRKPWAQWPTWCAQARFDTWGFPR